MALPSYVTEQVNSGDRGGGGLPDYVKQATQTSPDPLTPSTSPPDPLGVVVNQPPQEELPFVPEALSPDASSAVDELMRRMGGRADAFQDYVAGKTGGRPGKFVWEAPSVAAVAAGQIAGGIEDVIATGLGEAYKAFAPEEVQNKISEVGSDLMGTKIGKLGLTALEKGGEAYSAFKESFPEQATELESVTNIALFGGGSKIAKKTGEAVTAVAKEGVDVLGDVARLSTASAPQLNSQLGNIVEKNVWNMVRPSVFSKKSHSQVQGYIGDVTEAVKTLVVNKDNLGLVDDFGKVTKKLPENLWELSAAVENTKKQVFKQYDEMAKGAGIAPVDVSDSITELRRLVDDPDVSLLSPSAAREASKIADNLEDMPRTAEGVQNLIKEINVKLKPFYKNPLAGEAHKAAILEATVTRLRKSLDNHITNLVGEGYSPLKKQYKSLKAIEDEVGHRAVISARANKKGLMDFTDFYSGAQLMESMVTGSPVGAAKGAAVMSLKGIYKHLNDPNRFVKKMFKESEKVVDKMGGYKPKSKTGKTIKSAVDQTKEDVERLKELKSLDANVAP